MVLTGSGLAVDSGDVVTLGNQLGARQVNLRATRNLTLVESQLQATGDLTLLAGDTVRIRDSASQPFSVRAGISRFRAIEILIF